MATNKPKIVAYTDEETMNKLAKIANLESRSISKQVDYIIKKFIESYEKENKY